MSKSIVKSTIDERLKLQYESILADMNLSSSDAIRTFITFFTIHRGFPFEIKLPEAYTANAEAIREASNYEDLPEYNSHKDLRKELGI